MTQNRRSKQSARTKAAAQGLSYAQATGARPARNADGTDAPPYLRSPQAFAAFMEGNRDKPLQELVQRYLQDLRLLEGFKGAIERINASSGDAVTQIGAMLTAHADAESGAPRLDFGSPELAADHGSDLAETDVFATLLNEHGTEPDGLNSYDDPQIVDPLVELLVEILKVAAALRLPTDRPVVSVHAHLFVKLRGMNLMLCDADGATLYQGTQRLDLISQRQPVPVPVPTRR